MGHGSIQITTAEAGRLKIVLPYHPDRIAKIKRVKRYRWHPEGRYWTVPRTDEAVSHLLTLFAGEPVEVDASLQPTNVSGTRQTREPVSDQTVATNVTLLDQVRHAIRARHFSHRTEEVYVGWIRRFITANHNRHPTEMNEAEIGHFLSCLASEAQVSASTQNQALNALLFLP